jgi:membrane-associated protease RseP (regulator of RpoE activity)
MKTKPIARSAMVLALLSAGCASNPVAQQRGWIGGEFLVAKRASWRLSGGDARIVPALPKQLDGKQAAGIFVAAVYSNTPLAVAGIRTGDLILAVNQQPVGKLNEFRQRIDASKPGTTVSLHVFRDGAADDRLVTVGRETYKNWHDLAIGIMVSGKLELDLIPDPDFSLVALGYSRNQQRAELHSPQTEFIRQINRADQKEQGCGSATIHPEGWKTWLALFSLGGYKSVLSQEIVEPDLAFLGQP